MGTQRDRALVDQRPAAVALPLREAIARSRSRRLERGSLQITPSCVYDIRPGRRSLV